MEYTYIFPKKSDGACFPISPPDMVTETLITNIFALHNADNIKR